MEAPSAAISAPSPVGHENLSSSRGLAEVLVNQAAQDVASRDMA